MPVHSVTGHSGASPLCHRSLWCKSTLVQVHYQFSTLQFKSLQCSAQECCLLKEFILRCIRPPQSQSGTNNVLKTSVCADGSKHVQEIISCFTKLLKNFFLRTILYFCAFFGVLSCVKTFFSIKKNFLLTQILKCLNAANNLY